MYHQLNRLSDWGYSPISVSVKTGNGISNLKERIIQSKSSILCGPSGVGKTSVLQYLIPSAEMKVGQLSKRLNRGTHTTRNLELYSLAKGIYVGDSPGFNWPELKVLPSELAYLYFPFPGRSGHVACCRGGFAFCVLRFAVWRWP